MSMRTNIAAINSNRVFKDRKNSMSKLMQTASSGKRINSARDDAAGLAVSERMNSKLKSMKAAYRNTEDAISLIQTSEGYLHEIQDTVSRLRELSIQASNGIYNTGDRENIQVEVNQLVDEIKNIASGAEFNGVKLFDGSFASPVNAGAAAEGTEVAEGVNAPSSSLEFQVGYQTEQRQQVFVEGMSDESLGIKDLSVKTSEDAVRAIATLDVALDKISKQRSYFGAIENRLNRLQKNSSIAMENMQAAVGRIVDADMANTITKFTIDNILSQSNIAMLSQANLMDQGLLRLIG